MNCMSMNPTAKDKNREPEIPRTLKRRDPKNADVDLQSSMVIKDFKDANIDP